MKREVTIKRISNIFAQVQSKEELNNPTYKNAKSKITAPLSSNGNGQVRTGLEHAEQKRVMEDILDMRVTDHGFNREVRNWFADFSIDIPVDGRTFNISYDEEELVRTNSTGEQSTEFVKLPHDPIDYISWKIATVSPLVGNSKDTANPLVHMWYIENEAETEDKKIQLIEKSKEANTIYLSLNNKKYATYLTLLGVKRADKLSTKQQNIELDKLVKEQPVKFLEVHNDKNSQIKYFITELVNYNLWKLVGNTYIYDNESYHGIEEAITWLKDKNNSQDKKTLEARLTTIKD